MYNPEEYHPKKGIDLSEEERHEMAKGTILQNGKFTFDVWIALSNGGYKLAKGIKANTPESAIQKAALYKFNLTEKEYNPPLSRVRNIANGKVLDPGELPEEPVH